MDALALVAIIVFALNVGLLIRLFSMSPAIRRRESPRSALVPGVLAIVMLVILAWTFL